MPVRSSGGTNKAFEQDSAIKPKSVSASTGTASEAEMEARAAKGQAPTSVQPVEPEDAYLTGVSRSLQRRLLGLNVEGARGQAKPVPGETTAGLHSTGSHTATQGVKPDRSPKAIKNANKK